MILKSNLSLDLNYNLNNLAIENLFKPIISNFLHYQIGFAEDFKVLEAEAYISSYDFKNPQKASMEHIYLSFLDRINRIKKYLDIPISVFITFDKRQCSDYCSDSDRHFSSIKVGGVSKVYYILFTTDELFDFLYSKETGYVEKVKNNIADCNADLTGNSNKGIVETDKIISESEHIKGYLDNHNIDKGLSFVSCSEDSGYPVYHRDFPNILEIKVGSVLELEINSSSQFGKVVEYRLSDDKEIEGLIQFFDGVLSKRSFNAYINTKSDDVKTIFVPSDIARNFEDYGHADVSCLARNKKPIEQNQYKWVALQVVKMNKVIS
jgi:hypothetical protein